MPRILNMWQPKFKKKIFASQLAQEPFGGVWGPRKKAFLPLSKGQPPWGPRETGKLNYGSGRAKLGPGKKKAEGRGGIEDTKCMCQRSLRQIANSSSKVKVSPHHFPCVPGLWKGSCWGKVTYLESFPNLQFYLNIWVKEARGLLRRAISDKRMGLYNCMEFPGYRALGAGLVGSSQLGSALE